MCLEKYNDPPATSTPIVAYLYSPDVDYYIRFATTGTTSQHVLLLPLYIGVRDLNILP